MCNLTKNLPRGVVGFSGFRGEDLTREGKNAGGQPRRSYMGYDVKQIHGEKRS